MESQYGIMSYRQDLQGFGEPMDGMWDGFQRINTDTKAGGIIGIFRQGATETKRLVTINYLDPGRDYVVKKMNGDSIATASGSALKAKGFEVVLNKMYDGELFEIREQP